MAEKLGEGLLTALEDRPVSINVEAKKKVVKSAAKPSSYFGKLEHALLANSDGETLAGRQAQVVQRFTDLGLGRGIDATRNKPWIEKPSFQVRPLRFANLIGTEEGGSVEAYESDISSVQTLQLSMKQAVTAPTSVPVKIGLDGESSRSVSSSRRVVGRKVLNRTISFKEEFDAVPRRGELAGGPITPRETEVPDGEEQKVIEAETVDSTFEEKLTHWLIDRLYHETNPKSRRVDQLLREEFGLAWANIKKGESSIDVFDKWFDTVPKDRETLQVVLEWMYELCLGFINHVSTTHYVSSIKLGALEYSVMSEEEYLRTVSQAGTFGLDNIVSFVFKAAVSSKKTNRFSELKRVGKIKNPDSGDYYVPRGTYAEAVIGCEVKSIHNLIRHTQLRRVLRVAISKYIDRQRDSSVGPFLIVSDAINVEAVYFYVREDNMSLQATRSKSAASHFYIINSDKGNYVQDFHIVYAGTPKKADKVLKRTPTLISFGYESNSSDKQNLPYYLSTPLSFSGNNRGPLYFNLHPEKENTLFVLQSRLRTKEAPPEAIDPWIQGRDGYFINCHKRRFAKDGFLSIRRIESGNRVEYHPVCVPSTGATPSHCMVFRLVKPPLKDGSFLVPTVTELTSEPRRIMSIPEDEVFHEGLEMLPEEGDHGIELQELNV